MAKNFSDAFIRTITVELCCIVLRQLLLVMDASIDAQVECERRAEKVIASLVSMLTPSVYSEELFLEMFEDEFYNFEVCFNIFFILKSISA